jgi:hypothetical protein
MNRDKKENKDTDYMALSAWHRIGLAAGAGFLIATGFLSVPLIENSWNLPIPSQSIPLIGLLVAGFLIYYARFARW